MRIDNNCSEGTAPDLLYRFRLLPTFNETYGSDCGFSVKGYAAFGSIVLVLSSTAFLLHLFSISSNEYLDRLLVRITCLFVCTSVISAISVGFLVPDKFHFAFLAFFVALVVNVTAVVFHGFFSTLRYLKRAGFERHVSLIDAVGGKGLFAALGLILLVCVCTIFTGMIGISVTLSQGVYPIDDDAASAFWRVYCLGVASSLITLTIILLKGFTNLARLVDTEAAKLSIETPENRRSDLETASKFLRKVRWQAFINLSPGAVIPFILQAIVLPGLWYGNLIMFLAISIGGLVIWGVLRKFKQPVERTTSLTNIRSPLVEPSETIISSSNPMATV